MRILESLLLLVCVGLSSAACTPSARWGDRAFYSPAHRGYVIAAQAPDDRPAEDAETIVLVDPIGDEKLACKEDVEPFLGAHAGALSDDVKRDNAALASSLGLLPVTVVGTMGLLAGTMGFSAVMWPAKLAVPDARRRYEEGQQAFEERRWGAARQKLQVALAGNQALARGTRALFQLGRVYEQLGEQDLAARSYLAFVRRALVPSEAEYVRAEAYLEERGAALPECESREEVEVVWP